MEVFVLIMYLIMMAINWVLIYSKTEFNPNDTNRKYIIIKNRTLASVLIDNKSSYVKYVKVKDRQKLNIPCFVFYIAFALILLITIILCLLPEMPCQPTSLPFSRHNSIVLDTYNAKVPYTLSFLLFCAQVDFMFVPGSIKILKMQDQTIGSKIGVGILTLGFLLLTGYFAYVLFK